MVSKIYPTELHLNKANSFDTEAPILDMFSFKIYDKREGFNFEIVNFP